LVLNFSVFGSLLSMNSEDLYHPRWCIWSPTSKWKWS